MTAQGRRVTTLDDVMLPGDYCLTDEVNDADEVIGRGVWFLLPTADPHAPMRRDHTSREAWAKTRANGLHRVSEPPWTFRECADGSVEIQPSIACGRLDPEGEYWHGYLNEGNEWTTA